MRNFEILTHDSGAIVSLIIAYWLANLIPGCSGSCFASLDTPLNQSAPICFIKSAGTFSYYDALKFCASRCHQSYHDQGFYCPVLPDSLDQLESLQKLPNEEITIFLNSRSNLKLNRNCIAVKQPADISSWKRGQTKFLSCLDRVNAVICVAKNFDVDPPAAAPTSAAKEVSEDEEKLIYHRAIVEAVNNAPNATWKAEMNLAGLPDPKPSAGQMLQHNMEELLIYLIHERSTGRPFSIDFDVELKKLVDKQASLVRNVTKNVAEWTGGEDGESEQFPDEFDARLKWAKCSHIAQPTINQGKCGSCYAVSSIAVMSDRICIFSNQTVDVHLSVSEYLSCSNNTYNQSKCGGGEPAEVFEHWIKNGLATGGEYGSNEGCLPYDIGNDCGRPCSIKDYDSQIVPSCRRTCNKLYGKSYSEDLYFGKNLYYLFDPYITKSRKIIERNMKWELMNRGPFVASMMVPEDFLHYKSGVYQYVTGEMVYFHAVRMLGWGVENNIPYWLVSNSWGRDWGENGFYKILRGSNQMFIESLLLAGTPML